MGSVHCWIASHTFAAWRSYCLRCICPQPSEAKGETTCEDGQLLDEGHGSRCVSEQHRSLYNHFCSERSEPQRGSKFGYAAISHTAHGARRSQCHSGPHPNELLHSHGQMPDAAFNGHWILRFHGLLLGLRSCKCYFRLCRLHCFEKTLAVCETLGIPAAS